MRYDEKIKKLSSGLFPEDGDKHIYDVSELKDLFFTLGQYSNIITFFQLKWSIQVRMIVCNLRLFDFTTHLQR